MVTPPSRPDPLLGVSVGAYRVVRQLGTGGMGSVYLGENADGSEKVAIKFLHEHLSSNTEQVHRFYSEARSVHLIQHHNIVGISDMNVLPPGRYYLVMEYLEGRSLDAVMADGLVPMSRAVPILLQVCDALEAAHVVGVVHRDLKPENLMLVKRDGRDDFVKVLDFGVAKLHAAEPSRRTATGSIIGTPDYMAPEQANGESVDGRTDQYSLGIIAWELACGKTPFAGMPLTAMLVAHASQPIRPPHELNPLISPAMSEVILRALSKKPDERYPNIAAFAQALDRAAQQPVVPPPSPSAPSVPVSSPSVSKATPVVSTPAAKPQLQIDVEVKAPGRAPEHTLCQDLSRAGCFVSSGVAPPPILARVTVTLPLVGSLSAEVVRHVTEDQAKAWKMPQGYAVQFLDLKPEQRDGLQKLTTEGAGPAKLALTPSSPAAAIVDDPAAEKVLSDLRKRLKGDHYTVLTLPNDVEIQQVKTRGRELLNQLTELTKRPLSENQVAEIDAVRKRIQQASEILGTPMKRAELDGQQLNWKGVGACLLGGLRATELEELRAKFLKANEGVDARTLVHLMTADAHEREGQLTEALKVFEQVLNLDPLNLEIHHRRKALLKKLARP